MRIGSHVSMTGGLISAVKEAHSYGANAFMIYTGAPQNTRRSPVEKLKIEEGRAYMAEHGIPDVVVHAPYIINLASFKPDTYELATSFLAEEIRRTEAIGAPFLVLHPGNYTEKDVDYGTQRIIDGLNTVLREDMQTQLLLETMAGKGTEIGRSFEELKRIIDGVHLSDNVAVCLDTCHVHDAGYDIVNDLDSVLDTFDAVLGLERIKVVHVNGSLNVRGAKKDRHANLGATADNPKGTDHIGFDAIYRVVHHPRLQHCIFILETPWIDKDTNLYKEEIAKLRA